MAGRDLGVYTRLMARHLERVRRGVFAGALCLVAAAGGALAEPLAAPRLPTVDGGAICGAQTLTARAFSRHAGRHAGDGAGVSVHIAPADGSAWRAVVTGPAGSREVEGETCRAVARAAGVIAALMAPTDRPAATGAASATDASEVVTAALPSGAPPDAHPDAHDVAPPGDGSGPSRTAELRLAAGISERIGPGGDVAVAWDFAGGLEIELGARYGRARVEDAGHTTWLDPGDSDGRPLPPRIVDGEPSRWHRDVTAGRAAICRRADELSACLGAEAGLMSLSRDSEEHGRLRSRGGWIAPTAGASLTLWRFGQAAAYAKTSVGYAIIRPEFFSPGDELVHSPSRFSGLMSVGLAYTLR